MEYMSGTEIFSGVPSFAQGLQILLVDHDTLSLMYTASTLEQYSFKVTTTELASVALSMIRDQKDHYKLVMADINMPDMDNLAFLRVLLEKEIPVIFMSSKMNAHIAKKALAEGACFFLEKPISLEDMKNLWQHVYRNIRILTKDMHKPNCEKNINHGRVCEGLKINEADGVEALITTESQKQRAPGVKRLTDDKEEKGKEKKIKKNKDQTDSESIDNEKRMEKKDSNGSSTNKKSRAIWTPDLHLKFTAAISALGDKKVRPKSILRLMDVPDITMRQVGSHLQKYKSQVQRIFETGTTSLPSGSKSSSGNNKNELPPPKQSSLLCQRGEGTSSFGVRGNITQLATPNYVTSSPISVLSFTNLDYTRQNMNSGHRVLSHYTSHHTNIPNSLTYDTDMNEILKNTKPLGLEESSLKVSEMNLPSMNYMTPEVASPYISANTFLLPNEPPAVNQEQYYIPALTAQFDSEDPNQYLTEVTGINEVLELVPEQVALDNATNLEKLPEDFNDGSQKLDTTDREAPPDSSPNKNQPLSEFDDLLKLLEEDPEECFGSAPNAGDVDCSPNKNQPLSEYADLLKILEEDPEEYNCFGSAPNAADADRYCERVRNTLIENGTDPQ